MDNRTLEKFDELLLQDGKFKTDQFEYQWYQSDPGFGDPGRVTERPRAGYIAEEAVFRQCPDLAFKNGFSFHGCHFGNHGNLPRTE